jgi:hypothetical protein
MTPERAREIMINARSKSKTGDEFCQIIADAILDDCLDKMLEPSGIFHGLFGEFRADNPSQF